MSSKVKSLKSIQMCATKRILIAVRTVLSTVGIVGVTGLVSAISAMRVLNGPVRS